MLNDIEFQKANLREYILSFITDNEIDKLETCMNKYYKLIEQEMEGSIKR